MLCMMMKETMRFHRMQCNATQHNTQQLEAILAWLQHTTLPAAAVATSHIPRLYIHLYLQL